MKTLAAFIACIGILCSYAVALVVAVFHRFAH